MSDCWPSLEPEAPARALFGEGEHESLLDANFGPDLAHSLYNLGKIHYDKSDIASAEKYFTRALEILQQPSQATPDYSCILKTIGFLMRISSEKLETARAMEYVGQVEKILAVLAQDPSLMNAEYYYNLGVVLTYREDYPKAQENFLAAYQHAKTENSTEILAKSLLAVANNYFYNQEFDKSLDSLKQLDVLLKKINKSYLLGSMYLCAGRVYTELGLYDQAMISLRKANKILQEKKSWNLYGYLLLARGTIYKLMGEFEHALMFFYLAIDSTDPDTFKRLSKLIRIEIEEVNDSSVDLYLDRTNRRLREKSLGVIDFKHRFILLEILFLLAKNVGQHFNKESLAKAIWKDEYNPLIHDKLIYTSVSRLRKLIEPAAQNGDEALGQCKYIIRSKDGYTFNPHARIRFCNDNTFAGHSSVAKVDLGMPV